MSDDEIAGEILRRIITGTEGYIDFGIFDGEAELTVDASIQITRSEREALVRYCDGIVHRNGERVERA